MSAAILEELASAVKGLATLQAEQAKVLALVARAVTDIAAGNAPAAHHAGEEAGAEGKKGRKKREKKEKDPDQPKRPMSAFFLFAEERRASKEGLGEGDMVDDNGDKKSAAVVLGELWKNLDPALKKPYQDRAEELKEKYRHDVDSFRAAKGLPPIDHSKADKEKADKEEALEGGKKRKLSSSSSDAKRSKGDAAKDAGAKDAGASKKKSKKDESDSESSDSESDDSDSSSSGSDSESSTDSSEDEKAKEKAKKKAAAAKAAAAAAVASSSSSSKPKEGKDTKKGGK